MSEGITIHYKGCQLVAEVRDGRPVAYVRHDGKQLACFEGQSVIDCANMAKTRIDEIRHSAGEAPSA